MSGSKRLEHFIQLVSQIDAQADDAAGFIKTYADGEGEKFMDEALDRLEGTWGEDKIEAATRRLWLRSEILRRLPKVGRA
jgi:hypothetical protein